MRRGLNTVKKKLSKKFGARYFVIAFVVGFLILSMIFLSFKFFIDSSQAQHVRVDNSDFNGRLYSLWGDFWNSFFGWGDSVDSPPLDDDTSNSDDDTLSHDIVLFDDDDNTKIPLFPVSTQEVERNSYKQCSCFNTGKECNTAGDTTTGLSNSFDPNDKTANNEWTALADGDKFCGTYWKAPKPNRYRIDKFEEELVKKPFNGKDVQEILDTLCFSWPIPGNLPDKKDVTLVRGEKRGYTNLYLYPSSLLTGNTFALIQEIDKKNAQGETLYQFAKNGYITSDLEIYEYIEPSPYPVAKDDKGLTVVNEITLWVLSDNDKKKLGPNLISQFDETERLILTHERIHVNINNEMVNKYFDGAMGYYNYPDLPASPEEGTLQELKDAYEKHFKQRILDIYECGKQKNAFFHTIEANEIEIFYRRNPNFDEKNLFIYHGKRYMCRIFPPVDYGRVENRVNREFSCDLKNRRFT